VVVETAPVRSGLKELVPLEFRQVRRTKEEATFNGLIEEHHYLGYTQPVGEHLKYMVYSMDRPLACLAWSSAPRHLGPRDRFIGWSQEARRKNIRLIAYNPRFLILPWVEVPYGEWPASFLLSGNESTDTLWSSWKRSWIRPGTVARAIARRTGSCWGGRRAGARTI